MIPVAVTTAPREGERTLEHCVASLVRAGFHEIAVLAEPEAPVARWISKWTAVIRHQHKHGEFRNFVAALEHLLAHHPGSSAMLSVQDDTMFCQRVAAAPERKLWPSPQCGAISLYMSRRYSYQPLGLAPLRVKPRLFCGACAIAFRPEVARLLVAPEHVDKWRGHTRHTITEPERQEGVDTYIGETLTDCGWEIWAHRPSLAEHFGKISTLRHGGPHGVRRALEFPGEDEDALCLGR